MELKSMLKWYRDLPIMLKNSPIMQARWHLTLHLLYSEEEQVMPDYYYAQLLIYVPCYSYLSLYPQLLI